MCVATACTTEEGQRCKADGVKDPKLQLKVDSFACRPRLQEAVQVLAWLTMEPSEQAGLAAFEMPTGAEHGLAEHENVDGMRISARQLRAEVSAV